MNASKRTWLGIDMLLAVGVLLMHLRETPIAAQESGGAGAGADAAAALSRAIVTRTLTLKVDAQKGEPRVITDKVKFDRPVLAYWVAVLGTDIRYERAIEKPYK